ANARSIEIRGKAADGLRHGSEGIQGRTRRRTAAARSGSSASPIARTTAIRFAPAATTSATFVSSIPPIANQGTRAYAAAWRTYRRPTGGRPALVGVSNPGPTPA